jgi:hypothetical protein
VASGVKAQKIPEYLREGGMPPLASSKGVGNGYGDLHGVGLCPDRLAAAEVETVHYSFQMASIHVDKEVVVVNLLALEGVTGSAFDRIGVSSCSS